MKRFALMLLSLALLSQVALAAPSEAPPPRKSPRTPVNREALTERKPSIAPGSTVQGQATVIESEKLRIGDIDIRLFGIVPPQLSASHGPQARAMLDKLTAGQTISCVVRDRDQAGRYLATCTAGNADIALELLRRGLAVTARGSLAGTEYAQNYMAAEQAAQNQKAGLWSGVAAVPVVIAAPAPTPAAVQPPPTSASVIIPTPVKLAEIKKEEPPVKLAKLEPVPATALMPPVDDTDIGAGATFFSRYQILITGILMFMTAIGIFAALSMQRSQEKRDEFKALAAALRGELGAARGICLARLKTIQTEADDKAAAWPRIRMTLYQAYVGRLGKLGAELAHQIASIYGQASDYAAYYNSEEAASEAMPKKQALQSLVTYIDEVAPKLMQIEQSGHRSHIPASSFTKVTSLVEKSITTKARPTTQEKTDGAGVTEAAVEAAHEATQNPTLTAAHPIWETMRKFARERFGDKQSETTADDSDYAALLDEDIENMSFGEAEDELDLTPSNVTKIRPTGS